jgi:L-asparaginase
MNEAAKQRIYLLSTGGTIEKVYSEQTGAVINDETKIERYLQRLRLPGTEVIVTNVMNKDSLDMTDEDREHVYLAVLLALAQPAPIVISHGTDTMVQTGLYLEPRLPQLEVPIIHSQVFPIRHVRKDRALAQFVWTEN